MIFEIIGWCLFGLITGGIARFLMPGRDPMGCLGTILLGVAGSFTGGFLFHLLFGSGGNEIEPANFLGALIGSVVVLFAMRKFQNRA